MRTTLWPHQIRAVEYARRRPGSLLALDLGLGKTAVALALAEQWSARRILVACPLSVCGVWPREVERHIGDGWQVERLDRGPIAERARRAKAALDLARARGVPCVVVVANHEAVWREPFRTFALETAWDLLVVDESARSKSPSGRLSLFLRDLARRTPRRLGLTATPLPHSPLDAYAQGRWIDPSVLGTSYVRYRARYAVMGGYQGHEVVGWQNLSELESRLSLMMVRITKEEAALGLPPETDEERSCRLEPEAQRLYDKLHRDMVAAVGRGEVTAANALVRLLRLEQLCGGTLRTDEGDAVEVSTAKARLLDDTLEDLPAGPVVVFARFLADLDRILAVGRARGLRVAELSGRDKGGLASDATMRADVDLLAVQTQSGGVGVDLSRASTAIFYSRGWSLGDLLQCRGRLHRPGQTRPVTHVHLVAEGTVDEQALRALERRDDLVESVLLGVRQPDLYAVPPA
jgi:SNF2 family DNA or RNA helicase